MDYLQLAQALKEKRFSPFYVLRGDDAYFISRSIELFAGVVEGDMADLNLCVYDSDVPVRELLMECDTAPMLSEYRVIVVREWLTNLCEQDEVRLNAYLDNPSPFALLVVVDQSKHLSTFDKRATVVDCNRMDESQLVNWLRIKARKGGLQIEAAAANLLISYTNGNMTRISSEAEKLLAYSSRVITVDDVRALVTPEIDVQVFELANCLAAGNSKRAWELLQNMFRLGFSDSGIFSNLISTYRRMFYARTSTLSRDELAAKMGVKPWAIKIAGDVAERYQISTLKKCLELLDEQEYRCRSGNLNTRTVLGDTVLKLIVAGKK